MNLARTPATAGRSVGPRRDEAYTPNSTNGLGRRLSTRLPRLDLDPGSTSLRLLDLIFDGGSGGASELATRGAYEE